MNIETNLNQVFQHVFDDDRLSVTETTTATEVEGWDSMAHINLIVAIEKHFDIKFSAAELALTRTQDASVGQLLTLLKKKVPTA